MNNNQQEQTFLFESILKKRGKFYISQKTLDDIRFGFIHLGVMHPAKIVKFNELLKDGGYVVEKISNELSVIKIAQKDGFNSILDHNYKFWQLGAQKD